MEDYRGNQLAVLVLLVYEDEIRSVEGPDVAMGGPGGSLQLFSSNRLLVGRLANEVGGPLTAPATPIRGTGPRDSAPIRPRVYRVE